MQTNSPILNLNGCPGCGVINIDLNSCLNCGQYISPQEAWSIWQYVQGGGTTHLYATIKNSVLIPPAASLDLQITVSTTNIASGASCQKCKEFFPYAETSEQFRCWACKNIWT